MNTYERDSDDNLLPHLRADNPELAEMREALSQLLLETTSPMTGFSEPDGGAGDVRGGAIYQLKLASGDWRDQSESSYRNNAQHAGNIVRIVYAAPSQLDLDARTELEVKASLWDEVRLICVPHGAGVDKPVTEWLSDRLATLPRASAAPADEMDVKISDELHPDTAKLVRRFARSLANKLLGAQRKYGYGAAWANEDWQDECRADLMKHIAKGDPRDVAAYCAFMWHHNWSTAAPATAAHAQPLWYVKRVHARHPPEFNTIDEFSDGLGGGTALYGHPQAHAGANVAPADLLPNALWTRRGSGSCEWWSFKGYEARKDGANQWVLRKAGNELYRHTYLQVVMAHAERKILATAPTPIAIEAPDLTAHRLKVAEDCNERLMSACTDTGCPDGVNMAQWIRGLDMLAYAQAAVVRAGAQDERAAAAWEAYLDEQKRILGMPGLMARPSFLAGYRAAAPIPVGDSGATLTSNKEIFAAADKEGVIKSEGLLRVVRALLAAAKPVSVDAGLIDETRESLECIRRYGLDTLSGRVDGPDDRDWQRESVNEMTKRARLAIEHIDRAVLSATGGKS